MAVNEANAARQVSALQAFGFAVPELTPELFLRPDRVIRMGVVPNRIEIQTGIDGVRFAECFPRRITAELDGVRVLLISREDLKASKRASGRNKDLADLDELA